MTLSINLTPQLEAMVRAKVASGLYGSASEVIRQALRLMEEQDRLNAIRLQQLRQDIDAGLKSAPAGDLDIDAIKRSGRKRLAKTSKP